jgi:hypothetical protein
VGIAGGGGEMTVMRGRSAPDGPGWGCAPPRMGVGATHRGVGLGGGAADEQLVRAVVEVGREGVELLARERRHAHDDVHVLRERS